MSARRIGRPGLRATRSTRDSAASASVQLDRSSVNPDFIEFLGTLLAADARFLVVGAHALAIHGGPRATGDIDVWIERSPENAARVWRALAEFGAPTVALGVSQEDLETPDMVMVIQIGLPPRRIDMLTETPRMRWRH